MKKLGLIALCALISSNAHAASFPTDVSMEYIMNRAYDPAGQCLKMGGQAQIMNWPTVMPVEVSNFPAFPLTQTVNGSVTVGSLPNITVSTLPAITGTVAVSNFPATQPVSGTFWQTTQPVSGTVAVSNFPATQPISGSVTATISGSVAASQSGDWYMRDAGWSFRNIAGASTTVVKSGAGVLHMLVINKPIGLGTITLYDNTAASGTKIATLTNPLAILQQQVPIQYDIAFNNGLTVVTSAADDVTVSFR